MDSGVQLTKVNPYEKANCLSKLLFIWMIRLCKKCVKKDYTVDDLYKTLHADTSEKLSNMLEVHWKRELERTKTKVGKPSLFMAFTKTFIWPCIYYGFFMFLQFIILRTLQPVVLAYLIKLFSIDMRNEKNLTIQMCICGGILASLVAVLLCLFHHCYFGMTRLGMQARIAVSALIYRKLLRLNRKSLSQIAAGGVINLLSNDVSRFDIVSYNIHFLWIAPVQVAVVTYFIWEQVGISTLVGIASLIIFTVPSQVYLTKLTTIVRNKTALRTDKRIKVMNEIISGIQVIKMYAWEKPFGKLVGALRASEIEVLTVASYVKGFLVSSMVFTERSTLYFTLLSYTLLGNVITAEKVFSMSQFFNQLQLAVAIYLPMSFIMGAETIVSIRRLQEFLQLEEIDSSKHPELQGDSVLVKDVHASWPSEAQQVTLNGINLEIPSGKLCAVIGPVGSGKSSLLQLLLGELEPQTGKVSLCGTVSYSSQEPWLFVSTVRNNILFGKEYDKKRYDRVCEVCALLPDFKQFPCGDKTVVGERGVSLSGGQRARINLARAIYRDSDIYMLDDPLSAVDTHVGKHLFEKCIMNHLEGKTRILITHQLQYLKKADIIVVLNAGSVEAMGTFDDLAKSNFDFTKLMVAADETADDGNKSKVTLDRKISIRSTNTVSSIQDDISEVSELGEEVGLVGRSAYIQYMKAAGNWCVIATVVTVFIMGQVATSAADYWTSYWTRLEELRHQPINPNYQGSAIQKIVHLPEGTINEAKTVISKVLEDEDNYYFYNSTNNIPKQAEFEGLMSTNTAIYVYTGIIVALILLMIIRSFSFFKLTMIASKNLHATMFYHLLKAPMRFFDTNPSGRILNRFSKDIGMVDEFLPRYAIEAIQIMLVLVGVLVMIMITNYYLVVAMVFFGIFIAVLRKWNVRTAKVIKHLEGTCKSPVFSHLTSSLNGMTTIRACRAEVELIRQFDHHQDSHTSAYFLSLACICCYGLWLDIIAFLFTTCVIFSFIILEQFGEVNASSVGLAVSQSLILSGMLQYGVRQTAEVVNHMTNVERILQYTTLDEEGPFETPENKRVPESWPERGSIKFNKMYLKYSEFDAPVLKNLDFQINSGEKIGIVGRTGAGKSSLISALFRLAPLEGSIEVDGVDVKTLGLTDLRQKISIIPQEPVLFSASLRYNLDPFEKYDDNALWNALEEVELKEIAPTLDFLVEQGGSNFSLGQRQLVCLARAILKNNKILVLDEATANVDPKTDRLIQTTIRKKFANCTVLTIAHRLNTIMDSDRVIVMDNGQMVEYEHPHILLQNSAGIFTGMVNQTGPNMSKTLREVASQAYKKIGSHEISEVTSFEEKKVD